MNCIIVDDEPLGRKAIQLLVDENENLTLTGCFGDALSAGKFMRATRVDLVFLDIRMPEVDGIEFAKTIGRETLVVFTTAYAEYALNSYEVDAVDYLVKPGEPFRFDRAVGKAENYLRMLRNENGMNSVESVATEHIYVKSDRRFFKIRFTDILFVEGLKDYVIIHTEKQKIITRMNLKNIHASLPERIFLRVNKSYIVNTEHVASFDNNDQFIGRHEIPFGNIYREEAFKRLLEG